MFASAIDYKIKEFVTENNCSNAHACCINRADPLERDIAIKQYSVNIFFFKRDTTYGMLQYINKMYYKYILL